MEQTNNLYKEIQKAQTKKSLNVSYILSLLNTKPKLTDNNAIDYFNKRLIDTDNETEQLNLYIDNLKKELNKSYDKKFNYWNINKNVSIFKKVCYDKKYNEYQLISNVSTTKETDIFYILKQAFHKKQLSYNEYINAINRFNNRQQIKNDNNNKRILKNLIINNKTYLKGLKIDTFSELERLQYKKVFTDKIQNIINSSFKNIKAHLSKNTQQHLKHIENLRYEHVININGSLYHFRTKKLYTLYIEYCYQNNKPILLNSLYNNTLLNKECINKYNNDTTIINIEY